MQKLTIWIFATLVFCSLSSIAQVVKVKEKSSFFLGKRGTIDINLMVQPSLQPSRMPDKDIYEEDKYNRRIARLIPIYTHVSPELKYTFAINNRLSVYGKYNLYSRSKLDAETSIEVERNGVSDYFEEYGYAQLKGRSYGLGLQWFQRSRAAIAPIGFYYGVGVAKHDYNVTHEGMTLATRDPGGPFTSEFISIADKELDFSFISLDFEIGNNQPISKFLYYKLAVSSSANFGLEILGDQGTHFYNTVDEYLTYNAKQSMAFNNAFVLKAGVGFIIH